MSELNALESVVDAALELIGPLRAAARSEVALGELLDAMGWSAQQVDLAALRVSVTALSEGLEDLRAGLSFDSLAELGASLETLAGIGAGLAGLADELIDAAGAAGVDPEVLAEVTAALAHDLLTHLTLRWIAGRPVLFGVFVLVGLVVDAPLAALSTGGDEPLLERAPVVRPTFAGEALGSLLADPVAHLRQRLGVRELVDDEAVQQVVRSLFGPVLDLVVAAGGTGVVGIGAAEPDDPQDDDDALRRRATMSLPVPTLPVGGPPLTVWVSLLAELVAAGSVSVEGDAGPGLLLITAGALRVTAATPGGELSLEVTGGTSGFFPVGGDPVVRGGDGITAVVTYRRGAAGAPAVVLGADTAGLTVGGLTAALTARFGRSGAPELDVAVEAGVEQARFVLAPGEGDGFLASVLPADGLEFAVDLGVGWSNRRGLFFRGSASLEVEIPLHVDLFGVLLVDLLHLRLAARDDGLEFAVGATATLKLGPLAATVDRMGISAGVSFVDGGGNLGPVEVRPAFLPPRGVGMVVDAAVVKGGGFVLNDPVGGRYAGILELEIAEVVGVTAIGLIATRMADGSPGFSLLVILTATFPPIQLGYGFSLSGLGGILGLHRTMSLPALRDGVRTGVLDSILFPVDPVARANQVISDVESVFPVAPGRFVVGLMARLGWGVPQVVVVDLGVIVELPAPVRIALLGRVRIALPVPEAAVVDLRLDVVGTLDIGRGEMSIDATLRDSRIAVFDVHGDMALRVGWGVDPTFALSVGGFNPAFAAPPGFPDLRRLTIALATGPNPRVRLECYLAVTANTVQIGARLDAHAELDAGLAGFFTVDAYLGFDALVHLDPFRFVVDLGGGITIKRNRKPFLGAELKLTLSGPQPLRASGYAEVKFLGTHRIPIKVEVGDEPPALDIPPVDPTAPLLAALADPRSWSAQPAAGAQVVALIDAPAGGELLAHPAGTLTVRQRVVPLDLEIERFGGAPLPGGPRAFGVGFAIGDAPAAAGVPVRDAWAPADLFDLTDDEKLAAPAFEQLVSGATSVGAPGMAFGTPVDGSAGTYETSVIDAPDNPPRLLGRYLAPVGLASVLRAAEAAAVAARATGYETPGMRVTVAAPTYAVASTETLAAVGEPYPSRVEAVAALRRSAAGGLAVVGTHEVAP